MVWRYVHAVLEMKMSNLPAPDSFSSQNIKRVFSGELTCRPGKRSLIFCALLALGILVCNRTLIGLLGSKSDLYSHLPVIYVIIGYVLFSERKKIFSEVGYSPVYGVGLVFVSGLVYAYGRANQAGFSPNDYNSVLSLAFAVYLAGIFLICFGLKAFRGAGFAVFLLLFTIPIPDFLLDQTISFLQVQSYNAACWVLDALRFYPIKQGFSIILPDISVEVAKQCSGIRSSIALFIISVLYGRYFLQKNASRVLLVFLTLFIAPYKNGLRIATLVLLSIYWDKAVLSGSLHTAGGIPFFFIGLAWLSLVLWALAKLEKRLLTRSSNAAKQKI